MNFNDVFEENVFYDNSKSHKTVVLHPRSRKCIFGKKVGEVGDQFDPSSL